MIKSKSSITSKIDWNYSVSKQYVKTKIIGRFDAKGLCVFGLLNQRTVSVDDAMIDDMMTIAQEWCYDWLIDWLKVFNVILKLYYLNEDTTMRRIVGKRFQNTDLCMAWAGRDLYRATPAVNRCACAFVSCARPRHFRYHYYKLKQFRHSYKTKIGKRR